MNTPTRTLTVVLSLCVGLALALGLWIQGDRARALQRHDLWLAYVRGPLDLYNQGSREGARVLAPDLGRSGLRDLDDAIQDLDQAWDQAGTLEAGLESDALLAPLAQSLTWLGSSRTLAEGWPVLAGRRPDQISAAQATAEALRGHLSLLLGQVWAGLQQRGAGVDWSPAERVESQAALALLAQPLPAGSQAQKRTRGRRRHRFPRRQGRRGGPT